MMKPSTSKKCILSTLLPALLLLAATACTQTPSSDGELPADRETFARETYAAVEDTEIVFRDDLTAADYPADTPAGEWLVGCSAADRDEQFDAYTLRHESAADGHTTFTYLIYYPHGGLSVKALPELLESKSGYVLNLTYTPSGDAANEGNGYSLCYLSVTLPTENPPRLRLLVGNDALGVLSTVTQNAIPNAGK